MCALWTIDRITDFILPVCFPETNESKTAPVIAKAIYDCIGANSSKQGIPSRMLDLISFAMGRSKASPANHGPFLFTDAFRIATSTAALVHNHPTTAVFLFDLVTRALDMLDESFDHQVHRGCWAQANACLKQKTLEILLVNQPRLALAIWTHQRSSGPSYRLSIDFVARAIPQVTSLEARVECILSSLVLRPLEEGSRLFMAHFDALYPREIQALDSIPGFNDPGSLALLVRMALDDEHTLPIGTNGNRCTNGTGKASWVRHIESAVPDWRRKTECHLIKAQLIRIQKAGTKMSTLAGVCGSNEGWVPFGPDHDEKIQRYKLQLECIVRKFIKIEALSRMVLQFVE